MSHPTRAPVSPRSPLSVVAAVALGLAALATTACSVTTHLVQPATLGAQKSSADLLSVLDQPGPLTVETINSADWSVPRGGLINLSSQKAKAAGLVDGDEPIQIFFHAVRHPTRGLFIIDTGVERALRDAPKQAAPTRLIRRFMHFSKLVVHLPLGDYLAREAGVPAAAQDEKRPGLSGVFLTHMHIDHITGMRDVPHGTPIYAGPGEATARAFQNLFVRGTTNRAMEGQAPIAEWRFSADASRRFAGVLDVFGDGSFWALWTPGHTPGSTSYLARTPTGPVLFTGDTCHTAWGWRNQVEPGSYTADQKKNAESLARLEQLVREHPGIDVRLGHQYLPPISNVR